MDFDGILENTKFSAELRINHFNFSYARISNWFDFDLWLSMRILP